MAAHGRVHWGVVHPTRVYQWGVAGWHDLQPAVNDERSECTRSVPSVASRRVAAPYAVDVLAMGRSLSCEKRSNFQRATRAKLISAYVELATLAEPVNDGHLLACKFFHADYFITRM